MWKYDNAKLLLSSLCCFNLVPRLFSGKEPGYEVDAVQAYMMAYDGVDVSMFPSSYKNKAFSQSESTFSKCYFIMCF